MLPQITSPGELWQRVDRVVSSASASGALEPMEAAVEWIDDGGFRFAVQLLPEGWRERARTRPAAPPNPFLPYERALFVADLSATHVALLNKFPVIARHLLVVTRELVEQTAPLEVEDFEALFECMPLGPGFEALGFYNAGPEAGASQRHRHLQLVPLPLHALHRDGPLSILDAALARAGPEPSRLAELPFPHAAARFDTGRRRPPHEPAAPAAIALDLYRRCLRASGRDIDRPGPYNLLVTRRVLCVVPRLRECFGPVSVNALGFCGVLLARDRDELDVLRAAGPLEALRSVAGS